MYEKPSHYSGGTRGTIAFHQLYLLKLHFPYRSSISFGSIIARLIRVSRIETSRCSKSRQKSHLTPSFVCAISSVHNKESDSSELLRCKLIFNHRWRGGKRLSHSSNRLSISFYPSHFRLVKDSTELLLNGKLFQIYPRPALKAGCWDHSLF